MRLGPWDFIRDQWTKQKPVFIANLTGKTVIVLGANTGIGFEAAKHFASMTPGRLMLACRSQSKGQAAMDSTLSAAWLKVQSAV
jgi:NAD(P)-dependent dehydrogenase (short-subunit alcohol dehydrogenase family)